MTLMTAMEITASGLYTSRVRMNLAASNLANASTTRTADGNPYRRRDIVQRATPLESGFGKILRDRVDSELRGVTVDSIVTDPRPPRTVYDPSHPDADKKGIVRLPHVNMIEEMVDMITASRAYEAGVTTMQTIKGMVDRALSIGK